MPWNCAIIAAAQLAADEQSLRTFRSLTGSTLNTTYTARRQPAERFPSIPTNGNASSGRQTGTAEFFGPLGGRSWLALDLHPEDGPVELCLGGHTLRSPCGGFVHPPATFDDVEVHVLLEALRSRY